MVLNKMIKRVFTVVPNVFDNFYYTIPERVFLEMGINRSYYSLKRSKNQKLLERLDETFKLVYLESQ